MKRTPHFEQEWAAESLCPSAGMPIRQRGTLFGLTRVATPGLEKAMATQAEGLPDHIALIQYGGAGFVILVRPDPNYDILGKKQSTSLLIGFAVIWLLATINKTYGCMKSNHWGNGPVNDLTLQPVAHGGGWIIGLFQLFTHLRL